MGPELRAVALSAGVAAEVAGLGAWIVVLLARRSPPVAAALAPVVVVLSLAAGIWASSQAMFLSEADSATMLLVLLAAVSTAAGVGVLIAVLAIVKGVTLAHGGAVTVSNADDGCRFQIRLPTQV